MDGHNDIFMRTEIMTMLLVKITARPRRPLIRAQSAPLQSQKRQFRIRKGGELTWLQLDEKKRKAMKIHAEGRGEVVAVSQEWDLWVDHFLATSETRC